MKSSMRVHALIILVLSIAFFSAIAGVIATRQLPVQAAGTRTFTLVNNTSQTIWAGALGKTVPGNGGWIMAPGSSNTVTVPDTWSGRFWGRTYCTFNSSGKGTCETGDCGSVLQCNGAGGVPPATLAEFTLGGTTGNDFYDVSFVDGFNVPMTITPVGGAQPKPGDPYWCGVAGCGTDLNPNCPAALQEKDTSGRIVACKSACEAFNTDQFCCRGAFNTPATCKPANWPVDYANYFKSNCPYAYSYAYDDPTSTFQDKGASFKITFGPAGGSGGPTSPPPPSVGGSPTSSPPSVGGSPTSSPPSVGGDPTSSPSRGGTQINVGGPASGSFVADTDFTGGIATGHNKTVDTSKVSNPAPQKAYQDYRYGNFTYSIPGLKAGASYTVRLHFAEIYWSKAGQRIFNVKLNGQQALSNFDIFATAGGADKAIVKQFTTTADASGKITIQFARVRDNAQVNAIEVIG
jgi:hypothetical protein